MVVKSKKIIAKEFLLLMLAIGISIIYFFLTFAYNYYYKNEIKKASDKIITKQNYADSLMKTFEQKKYRLDEVQKNINELYSIINSSSLRGGFESYEELSSFLSKPENVSETFELINCYDDLQELFLDYEDFFSQVGIKETEKLTKTDSLEYKKGTKILEEVNIIEKNKKLYLLKLLTIKEQLKFSLYVFIILFIFLFVFRYIYNAILWSYKVLRSN